MPQCEATNNKLYGGGSLRSEEKPKHMTEVKTHQKPKIKIGTMQGDNETIKMPGVCEDNEITIFLDTGSPVNLISYDKLQNIQKSRNKKVTFIDESDITLYSVDGKSINCCGMTQLTFTLSETTSPISARFYIVDNLSIQASMLVGLRTMRNKNIILMPYFNGLNYEN